MNRASVRIWLCAIAASVALGGGVTAASAQAPTTWYLAEGSTGFFEEEILIANPSASAADVEITYLREGESPIVDRFVLPSTSRKTVRVNARPGLESGAVSAVVTCTNGLELAVERSMYWMPGRRGGHNATSLTGAATRWLLAEGATGMFDAFILIANPDTTRDAAIKLTFLTESGVPIHRMLTVGAQRRFTVWVNEMIPELASASFSVVVESTNDVSVFVERAMYYERNRAPNWEGGHSSGAVTTASTRWLFGEGYTGPGVDGRSSFDTFILLGNPDSQTATVTVTFLRDTLPPVERQYTLAPTQRLTVWTNFVADDATDALPLSNTAFSIVVDSSQPIVAERAVYWGSGGAAGWYDGHASVGVSAGEVAWGFAEGAQDRVDETRVFYDSFFLVANANDATLQLEATFVREDGTGIVRNFAIAPRSRFTLSPKAFPELSNQRFGVFLRSVNPTPLSFAAERAMYWGTGWLGGHASPGAPWHSPIATPPVPSPATASRVEPASGSSSGGTPITVSGANFAQGATVTVGGNPATQVDVLDATTIRAIAPAGALGAADIVVRSAGAVAALPAAFTYLATTPEVDSMTPAASLTVGGTVVVIRGRNLGSATAVTFGGTPATSFAVEDSSTLRAKAPPRAAGAADVRVTAAAGVSAAFRGFRYELGTATDTILAFGDSITYGTTAALVPFRLFSDFLSVRTTGYPERLKALLQGRYKSQVVTVANSGWPGEQTWEGVRRIAGQLLPSHDLVVLQEGVNDLIWERAPAAVRNDLRTLVQTMRAAGKQVILGTLTPVTARTDMPGCTPDIGGSMSCWRVDPNQVAALNNLIRALANELNVPLADFGSALSTLDVSADGLHPNGNGYQRMAEVVAAVIIQRYETVPPIVP